MTPAFVLRRFATSDQPAARALILRGMAEHWGAVDEALNSDLNDIAASFEHGAFWVAEQAGRLIGTGGWLRRGPHTAEIVRMSVDAAHRRAGVGRALVERLVEDACEHEADTICLETNDAWQREIAFYEACGFRRTHRESSAFGSILWFRRACDSREEEQPLEQGEPPSATRS